MFDAHDSYDDYLQSEPYNPGQDDICPDCGECPDCCYCQQDDFYDSDEYYE